LGARLAHGLTKPFDIFPHLRDGLIVAAQVRPAPNGPDGATDTPSNHFEKE
jgi:uncharacterized protein (DUF952 family)